MKTQLTHKFEDIISIDNLLEAWKEFQNGKRNKKDVQEFSLELMDNIFSLNRDLFNHTYKHAGYQAFKINDPKSRDIHKAQVRDRLLHHAIYRMLYPFFDKIFIADSYSCRNNKGTYRAINQFRKYFHKVSQNNTKTCWVLKCDIKKFFANINHDILIKILKEYIPDKNIICLLENVIESFASGLFPQPSPDYGRGGDARVGLPLGNLTSQLFVNIYMNKFDQFMKHKMKANYYIRYADDFIILSDDKKWLKNQIPIIHEFLERELKLKLHPDKIFIKTFSSGLDFLGTVNFPDHQILRTKTKRRMFKKLSLKHKILREELISRDSFNQSLQSYLGMLQYVNGNKVEREIKKVYDKSSRGACFVSK